MRKFKILFTDVHQPEYHDKNPFREGFEWGKKVILDLCVEVDLDDMFNIYIEQPEKRIRNGRVIKFSQFAIEYLEQEQKKQREALQAEEDSSKIPPLGQT
ncbi:MAG: hypothetical protein ACYDHZ_08625 [Dehalococcoidia bacterium]|jgi:hypothetical protein